MASETLSPDAHAPTTMGACALSTITSDPDSGDGNWCLASGNNTSGNVLCDFATPTGNPSVGADLQEFRAEVRQFDTGQSGNPDARIELWENGSLVRAGGDVSITGSGQVIAFTWNANELATADGSLVQAQLVLTKSGGSPGARNTVDLGGVEWNVEFTSATNVNATLDTMTLTDLDATVQADVDTNVSATLDTLTLTDFDATVQADVDLTVSATLDTLTLTDFDTTVTEGDTGVTVNATLDTLTLTDLDATVQADVDTNVSATLDTLTLTDFDTTVQADVDTNISATLDTLVLTELATTVQADVDTNVNASIVALTLTALATVITEGSVFDGIGIDRQETFVINTNGGSVSLYFNDVGYFTFENSQ